MSPDRRYQVTVLEPEVIYENLVTINRRPPEARSAGYLQTGWSRKPVRVPNTDLFGKMRFVLEVDATIKPLVYTASLQAPYNDSSSAEWSPEEVLTVNNHLMENHGILPLATTDHSGVMKTVFADDVHSYIVIPVRNITRGVAAVPVKDGPKWRETHHFMEMYINGYNGEPLVLDQNADQFKERVEKWRNAIEIVMDAILQTKGMMQSGLLRISWFDSASLN